MKTLSQYNAIIHPAAQPLSGTLTAQPSKNYTTRYLLMAGLASGTSTVYNCATSADSRALQSCLKQLGAVTAVDSETSDGYLNIRVDGVAGKPRLINDAPINPGNAGAVLRFLLAIGALVPEIKFVTDHLESLGKRPNDDLLDTLTQLGCTVESNSGKLPITIRTARLHGGEVTISGEKSSQFLSGLLFLAPLIGEPLKVKVTGGLVSKAPVRQTLEVLAQGGAKITASTNLDAFEIQPSLYKSDSYRVNGDWPGSAALLAAAAVTGGDVTLKELYNDAQGEKESATVLQSMGAQVSRSTNSGEVRIVGPAQLSGIEFDGDLATDAVLALMGAACLAEGRTRFYNVSNLRIKECDRISEPITELRKLGVQCWEGKEVDDPDPDAIVIEGNPNGYEGGITVDGRNDHRVIMLLSIVALRCRKPVTILRAHEISKSYPTYFGHLQQLGARIEMELIHE